MRHAMVTDGRGVADSAPRAALITRCRIVEYAGTSSQSAPACTAKASIQILSASCSISSCVGARPSDMHARKARWNILPAMGWVISILSCGDLFACCRAITIIYDHGRVARTST